MEVIDLAWWKLGLAALLVLALAATAYLGRLDITRSLLVAAIRTVIQLALIGLVLEALFASSAFYWIALLAAVMYAPFAAAYRDLKGKGTPELA